MTSNSLDEMNQKPHKRTGVWANETVKSKSSTDNAPVRFSRKYMPAVTENEDTRDQYPGLSKNFGEMNLSNIKSRLLKLPAFSSLSSSYVASLLSEFNKESDVQENDSPWTQDSLLAELMDVLNKK